MSREELADRVGLSPGYVARCAREERFPGHRFFIYRTRAKDKWFHHYAAVDFGEQGLWGWLKVQGVDEAARTLKIERFAFTRALREGDPALLRQIRGHLNPLNR